MREDRLRTYQAINFFPPARYFYDSQQHMEADPLYEVFRRMPKGGVLHMHAIALTPVEWIMAEAIEREHCYVYWGDEPTFRGQIRFFAPGKASDGYRLASELVEEVPQFEEQWLDLMTLDTGTDGDSVDIWFDFERYFGCVAGFISYQPAYKAYYRKAYQSLIEDGIQHIELRMGMGSLYDLKHERGYFSLDSAMTYQQELLREIQVEHPEVTLRLIYTSLRRFSPNFIKNDLIRAYELQRKFPDLVGGYDLVGEEDAGRPTLDFLNIWLMMDSLDQTYGFKMELFLHDGESNWQSNENLYDAVLLGSKRIGHGFNLYRFPALWDSIRQQQTCIEICPLSNQILGYVRDLRNHPGLLYLKLGLPVSISSDDPATFGYEGVSPDYWAIFLAWELDLGQLKQLVRNSLTYSSLPEEAKTKALQHWEAEWNQFVNWSNAYMN
ncbi:MAG: adenosine kinase [Bacteroidota bacterium]